MTCGIPSRAMQNRGLQRLLSQTTEDRERAGEEVEKREGDCGERFRVSRSCCCFVFLNRCMAAFTREQEAQFHKRPKKPLVRSCESAEDSVDGGNGAPHTLIMEGVSLYSQICFSCQD